MNVTGSKHLVHEQRVEIEACLNTHKKLKEIAQQIGKDERTISKEIKKRRNKVKNGKYGQFDHKDDSVCKTISKYPFVCNGCDRKSYCFKEYKYYYDAKIAQENYEILLVDSRIGIDFSLEEKLLFDETMKQGIENGQSVYHIVSSNPDKIKCSVSTAYRLINQKKTVIQKMDLRRAVKLKERNHYVYKEDNREIREGRKYSDFLKMIASDLTGFPIITEIDTVEGPQDQDSCLLTIHITNTHFMFAKHLEHKSSKCVGLAFEELKKDLGIDLYKKIFNITLTDRGTEFCDPASIEVDFSTGEKIANLFFCNSYASYQKGAIEENHTLLRYVIPKKTYFDDLSNDDLLLILSHINSYRRQSIDDTPYNLSLSLFSQDFLNRISIQLIPADSVLLTPTLIK